MKDVYIAIVVELDYLELLVIEQYKNRKRMRQALAIWGVIAIAAFLGIIAIIDRYLIIQ